jgi:probable HAF family extracellular repeat protein
LFKNLRVFLLGSDDFPTEAKVAATRDLNDMAPSPNSFSVGSGLNDDGQVTGTADTASGNLHAFLYSNGQMMDLGTLPGLNTSQGSGINNHGQVTWYSYTVHNNSRSFIYSDGQFVDLGTLEGGTWSAAYAINDAGQVTGTAQTFAGEPASLGHAFIYSDGQMIDLGTLGGRYSVGFAINNMGQVVGQAETSSNLFSAFLYSDGVMTDLNDLVDLSALGFGKLYGAEAINDSGQILAGACATPTSCTGLGRLLLTPVPEPVTLPLIAAALLVLTTRFSGCHRLKPPASPRPSLSASAGSHRPHIAANVASAAKASSR